MWYTSCTSYTGSDEVLSPEYPCLWVLAARSQPNDMFGQAICALVHRTQAFVNILGKNKRIIIVSLAYEWHNHAAAESSSCLQTVVSIRILVSATRLPNNSDDACVGHYTSVSRQPIGGQWRTPVDGPAPSNRPPQR